MPEIASDTFSPEVTVTYTPTDDLTLFASYKKGYKSGSFTTGQLPPPPRPGELPNNSFGDEQIEGGEAGVKTRLFDRQVTVDLAGYYYDVTGLQVGANEADGPGDLPVTRTVNAGAGRIYGADFEISWWPRDIDGLNLHAAVAWNKSKFTELDTVPCYGGQTIALGCTESPNPVTGFFTAQNLNGIPFLRAPEWQATFGAVYEMPLPGGWSLTLSNDNHYSSRYLTALGRRADFIQDDYLQVDLRPAQSSYRTPKRRRREPIGPSGRISDPIMPAIISTSCARWATFG
ncbi:TonB-dependent receptor domain-containing protein [Sphingomonas cavernae]|uniref:TonB-dependent receptor n=1 Tax=Sphingomonas cavernae TaxID=2320861 RepID=A0A418WNN3_9SPHN|nr:TonB-dependent receptor [Sphingomonas cavernae]RJF91600.1 TonB-dependent receptor [Sphingomonas cavernae]